LSLQAVSTLAAIEAANLAAGLGKCRHLFPAFDKAGRLTFSDKMKKEDIKEAAGIKDRGLLLD